VAAPRLLQANQLDQTLGTFAANLARHIEQATIKIKRLFGVEELVEVRFLRQVPDAFVFRDLGCFLAKDERSARTGKEQAEDQFDGRRLPGPVGAQQAEDLPALDLDIQGFEGLDFLPTPEITVNLPQPAGFDHHLRLVVAAGARRERRGIREICGHEERLQNDPPNN
jgi:hypothetical protein